MIDILKKIIKYGSYAIVVIDILKHAVRLLEANEKQTTVEFEEVKND